VINDEIAFVIKSLLCTHCITNSYPVKSIVKQKDSVYQRDKH